MIKAWIFMASISEYQQRPKVNMNTYAKYRNEISSIMREAQSGKKNSQWGKKWYTNRDTGESNSFLKAPNEKWILGRNLFHGEFSKLHNKSKKIKNTCKLTYRERFELYKKTKK